MVIKTTLTAKSNGTSTVKPALKLYKGDIVYVELTLCYSLISSINGVDVEDSIPMKELKDVKLKLLTPNGTETFDSIEIVGNNARFKIQANEEIGEYPFMVVCYDDDGCVFHLPKAKYTIADTL